MKLQTRTIVWLFLPLLGSTAPAGTMWIDVTTGGAVTGLPNNGNWPGGEAPAMATDNSFYTKFLHFDKLNTGFTVTASNPSVPVTGMILTTANDAEERDPASYLLEGSNDGGGSWTPISSGALALPFGRNTSIADIGVNNQFLTFSNSTGYGTYRVTFPTVKNAGTANSMQIGEVSLLGLYNPGSDILDLQSYSASIVGGSFPVGEEPGKAIDNDVNTKYLNFGKEGTGLLLSTAGSPSIVTGIALSQANDAPARDVINFTLRGSNDGTNFTDIVTNVSVGAGMGLFEGNVVNFANATPYRDYQFVVTGLRSSVDANSFQFSEVQLLGSLVPEPSSTVVSLLGLGLLLARRHRR